MSSIRADRIDALVQARLAEVPKANHAELARALRSLAPATWDDRTWATEIEGARTRVAADGAARAGLPRAPWKRLLERIVPGLALGIAADDARAHKLLKDRDAWAAAIVGRALGLWQDGPPPSLSSLCDALVWRELGLRGRPKRNPPEVRAYCVARALGIAGDAPDRIVRQAAVAAVGAPRADLRALREGLGRRWLQGLAWPTATPPAPGEPAAPALDRFSSAVRSAAADATDGAFGSRKVFISAVWRRLRDQPAFASLTLHEFKRDLVAAHTAGLVALARADLTGAMDPAEVAASETTHLEARYHFVEREGIS